MIEKYDVEIDADGDGANMVGTVTILGHEHKINISASGRDLMVELDGKPAPDGMEFDEWLDPYDAVQAVLKETDLDDAEDWSGRVVNGKVVRLLVSVSREIQVVRGVLTDLPVE